MYEDQKRYREAIMDYTMAIGLHPDAAYLYRNRAEAYIKLGEYERAKGDLDRASRLQPRHVYLYGRYGELHYALGKYYKEAIQNFQEALSIDPSQTWIQFGLALALLRSGQDKKAIDAFDRGIDISRYSYDFEDAEEGLDKVLAEEPNNVTARKMRDRLQEALKKRAKQVRAKLRR